MPDANDLVRRIRDDFTLDTSLIERIRDDLQVINSLEKTIDLRPDFGGLLRPRRYDVSTSSELETVLRRIKDGDAIRLLNNITYEVVGGLHIVGMRITFITNGYTLEIATVEGGSNDWGDGTVGCGLLVAGGHTDGQPAAVLLDDSRGGALNVTAACGYSGIFALNGADVTVTNVTGRVMEYHRDRAFGVDAVASSKVTVKGNVYGVYCGGIYCESFSEVNVLGDVQADYLGVYCNSAKVSIKGCVYAQAGVYSSNSQYQSMCDDAKVTVDGDIITPDVITLDGTIGVGAAAESFGAQMIVGGDVTAGLGAYAATSGIVTINGKVNAPFREYNLGGEININE